MLPLGQLILPPSLGVSLFIQTPPLKSANTSATLLPGALSCCPAATLSLAFTSSLFLILSEPQSNNKQVDYWAIPEDTYGSFLVPGVYILNSL